jgi:hypothetical protein
VFFGYPGGNRQPNVNAAAFPWLGYGGDDACANERAADPLHCARIDSEPLGNDAHTSSREVLQKRDGLHRNSGLPKLRS